MSSDTTEPKIHYRVIDQDRFEAPADHEQVAENPPEYHAPENSQGIDALEVQEVIEVLDWHYIEGEEPIAFDGPPEPVVRENGQVDIIIPNGSNGPAGGPPLQTVQLGTFVCKQCSNKMTIPIENGDIQEPYQCSACERQGPFVHKGLSEYPNIAPDTFADPQWYAPSEIDDSGYSRLWDDVREWIHENWVAHEDHLYDGLAAFAISTWVRPNLNFLPQLMVMGKHDTGKTRLLTTLARICYRGRVPVSFTPAALFRTIDKYGITLFLSEYHDLNDDLRDEVNAVIKGSQKRGEDVMRVEKNGGGGDFEPVNFDIFTHVGLGTQFDPPDDIISRCIEIQTKPADRDVPVWFDEDQAEALRNRLLYARFRLIDSEEWEQAEVEAMEWLAEQNVNGRLREKLLCLYTVANLWDRVDAIRPFVEAMITKAESASADSDDALVIQALIDLAHEEVDTVQTIGDADPWDGLTIPVSDVAERFNAMTGRDVGSSYIGQIRKRLGIEKRRHSDGVVIKDPDLREKLERFCEENNMAFEPSDTHRTVEKLADEEQYHGTCSECGQQKQLAYRHAVEGHHMCAVCGAELKEANQG